MPSKTFSEHIARKLWDTGRIESQKLILSIIGSELVLNDDILSIIPNTHFEALKQLSSHQSFEANSGSKDFACSVLGSPSERC